MTAYEFFKDFAGPTATVLAAGAAVLVTYRVGRRQAATAERQAAIASDKLRADLFDRKFAAYAGAMKVSEIAIFEIGEERRTNPELHLSTRQAMQGQFLFPPEIFERIKEVVAISHELISLEGMFERMNAENPNRERREIEINELTTKLINLRKTLPDHVRPDMHLIAT